MHKRKMDVTGDIQAVYDAVREELEDRNPMEVIDLFWEDRDDILRGEMVISMHL